MAEEVYALRADDRAQVDERCRSIVIARKRELTKTGGTPKVTD
jgi:hypothetical protein